MLSSALLAISLFLTTALAAEAPVFVLSCDRYPDVCDTHCYALACSGSVGTNFRDVHRYLHYAANSSSTQPDANHTATEADYRRQAIGCGNNPCAKNYPGTQCDEFPYASTYDGGLGCIRDRYRGSGIATSGVWHCANQAHNGAHGQDLQRFYQNLADGAKFQVGFNEATVDSARGCRMIREGTTCARVQSATGKYEVVTEPGSRTYCPGRRGRRRSTSPYNGNEYDEDAEPMDKQTIVRPQWDGYANITWTRSVDAHGNVVLFPYRDDAPPAMTSVFHVKRDGSVLQSHIV